MQSKLLLYRVGLVSNNIKNTAVKVFVEFIKNLMYKDYRIKVAVFVNLCTRTIRKNNNPGTND